MTPHEQVAAAAKLIASPAQWSRGALARDKAGREVSPRYTRAASFCARGALMRVTDYHEKSRGPAFDRAVFLMAIADRCASLLYKRTLDGVNDDLGHEATLAVLRRTWRMVQESPPKEDAFGRRDD